MERTEFSGGEVEMNERGVYWARSLSPRGNPIAYAVDSSRRKIRSYEVMHPTRANMALTMLWNDLEKSDPTPEERRAKMHLILPTTEHRAWIEAFDPYNLPPLQARRRG
jgi:hypothetical protein